MATLPKLELSDVLAHVSDQLVAADKAARDQGRALMQLEECEVEFALKLEVGAKGGIKFWIAEIGGSTRLETSNKIKVKFKPLPGVAIQAVQQSLASAAPAVTRQTKKKD